LTSGRLARATACPQLRAISRATYSHTEAGELIATEVALANDAAAIVCVAEGEARTFRTHQSAPVHVLSHSVELANATPDFCERAGFLSLAVCWNLKPLIVWVCSGLCNRVGRRFEHTGRTPLCRLWAICTRSRRSRGPGVQLLGPATDLRPHYDSARVFIGPMRFGASIPIKIIEATAAGLPTAGTRLMAH